MEVIKKIREFFLGQKTVSQFQPDPQNRYACLFTCYYMFIQTVCGYRRSWAEYKRECVRAGALREDFYVLNHNRMLEAAGFPQYRVRKAITDLQREVIQSVLNGRPAICSLNGEHWVSIDGWLHRGGEILFTIDDPARAGQAVFCGWDLRPFTEINNRKIYQTKRNSRERRQITSVFLVERATK